MMKKIITLYVAVLLVGLSSCSDKSATQQADDPPPALNVIEVSPDILKLPAGGIRQITAVAVPADSDPAEQPFVWTTSNPGVATVSNGQVRGVTAGNAVITVSGRLNAAISTAVPATVSAVYYSNPVTDRTLPDPTVIRAADGRFYLYATEEIANVPIMRSSDLVSWSYVGTCFTAGSRPSWGDSGAGIWAPDINYINGKYVLYYSLSAWGGEWTCGIGTALSDKPEGPFTDNGALFTSSSIGVQNSIDPFYMEDGGKKYLFWGSFRGIYGIELSTDGLTVKPGATKTQIAGTAFEGTYIHYRNGYYYLFASIGSCCNGANSTYKTVVGRSGSLFGPYLSKDGESTMNNGYTIVIRGDDKFAGTGHNAEIMTDDAGNDWMLYHAYLTSSESRGRLTLLDKIVWTDGWPSIAGGVPSRKADAPVIYSE